MKILRLINGIILLMLLAVSCEYEPKGLSERSIHHPGPTPSLITLELDLPLDRDTVMLPYRHIWYGFESPGHEINWIRWYIDASPGETVKSAQGYFELPPFRQPDGWHRLKLEVCIASGTGSLADSLEMEGTIVTVGEWVITLLDTPYRRVTASSRDGFLRLRWPPAGDEQIEYSVTFRNKEIAKTFTCEYTDKGYVGQGGYYSVSYFASRKGETVYYGNIELPEVNMAGWRPDRNNNYYITFGKPTYYSAVDTIVLVAKDNRYGHLVLDRTADAGQSLFTLPDSLFGAEKEFWLVMVPRYRDPSYMADYSSMSPFATPRIKVNVGYPSPAFEELFRTGPAEFLYHGMLPGDGSYRDYLLRYSVLSDTILDYVGEPSPIPAISGTYFNYPSVSADGSYFTARLRNSQSAAVGSVSDLAGYKVVDISAITSSSLIYPMPVSNSGVALVIGQEICTLYDFRNETVLGTLDGSLSGGGHGISFDGRYLFLRNQHEIHLFSWLNGILNPLGVIPLSDTPYRDIFVFWPDESGMAARWDVDSQTFFKIRCTDMEIQYSFTTPGETLVDIDFYNRMVLCVSPYKVMVRSLDDGRVLHSFPASFSNAYSGMLKLCGGSVFHKEGLRYFLH
jgi:hypothetical protein